MKSDEVRAALRAHYGREAVLVSEVGDSVGFDCKRHLDAVAIGCWPSRGLYLHGIEIKVSRSDARRELKDPSKADAVARFCDAFFLAAPEDMLRGDELPETWGLYEIKENGKVKLAKPAAKLKAAPIERSFIFALARVMVQQASPESERIRIAQEAEAKGYREGIAYNETVARDADARYHETQRELLAYRSAVRGRTPHDVGTVIDIIDSLSGRYGALNSVRVSAKKIIDEADHLEAIVKALIAKNAAE